ncbi:putative amino acid transporter [Trypanosoma rangeli]|uniref:Putative amino acid transporter n=1 Tax=Trypanosoma rangeli TaxID=5698 RepID=A0A422N608_TRYRA|nr:putative amino acid transporter [Trypanosoma rangeli]RNF00876.1 putative amino acid transporter [Trypanosoma rangeli]|eukprot:RNF00876.1 putative amino acid transporter [Trypanosoma rangeli]
MRTTGNEETALTAMHPSTLAAPGTRGTHPNDATLSLQPSTYNEGNTAKKEEANAPSVNQLPAPNGLLAKLNTCVNVVIPPGGILASAFNLASSSIGAGILGLPLATNKSGVVMAIVYLAIITFLTIYSVYALGVAAQRTKIRSYEAVALVLMGRWFALFVASVRVFHGFSACVAYVISVGDIFKNVLMHSQSTPKFLKTTAGNRLLTVVVWLCAMMPLVIPKHIDSLRYFSTFAVSFIIYFVVVIVVHSCTHGLSENIHNVSMGKDDNSAVVLFNSGNEAIEGLGVFMFAYVCQINAYEVYWDMKNPTLTRFTFAAGIGMTLCFLLYGMTSFFGYMDFGKKVNDSILLMYHPLDEPEVLVAYIGVLSKLCASYAMLFMAARNAIYHGLGWDVDKLPYWKHCIAVSLISAVALLCGLFIPRIQIVLGFAGSISGGCISFIFPAFYVMYAGDWTWKKVGAFHYILTYVMLVAGVVGVVFGTGATIYDTAVG